MDAALLWLVGQRAELALGWHTVPSGVLANSNPQLGEWSFLAGPALHGRAELQRLPDTRPNIALPAPPILVVDRLLG